MPTEYQMSKHFSEDFTLLVSDISEGFQLA